MHPDEHGNFIRTDADRHPDPRERAEIERRQVIDDRFVCIDKAITALRFEMANNTEITKQVRDVLASFRVIGAVSKWLTLIGGFAAMCYHGVMEWRK